VKELEELITPKLVPIAIPIGVGEKVTLIDIVTHASKVFRTPFMVLKDTPLVKRPWFEPIPLTELIETTSEQLVNDLVARI
jgi:hypothetical protein